MRRIKIDQLVAFNPSRPIKKGSVAPFIDMAALSVDSRDISEIGSRQYKGGGSRFANGDTLFARITPCLENGKTAKVSSLAQDVNAHGSTEFIVMAALEPEFDEDFVYYLARLPEFRSYAKSRMEGTSGRQRVSWQAISQFESVYLPQEVRKEIGSTLARLDDKIELNHQTNQTLEQIAQAIFKSWFVDFEQVKAKQHIRALGGNDEQTERAAQAVIAGAVNLDVITAATDLSALDQQLTQALGEKLAHQTEAQREQLATTASHFPDQLVESELGLIAAGWKWQQLSLLSEKISKGTTPRRTDIVNAEDPRTVAFLKVRDISDDGEISRRGLELVPASVHLGPLKRSVLETEDLLFSIAGTIGRVAVLESDLAGSNTNQAVAFIRLKDKDNLLNLCRLNLVSDRIQKDAMSRVVQGVQANLSLTSLGEMMILLPSNETLEDLNAVISPITESKKLLITQIRSLAMIRDTLLPKLLSGELAFADQIPAKEVINV